MKSRIKFLASVIFWWQWSSNQRDKRPVLTKREGRNLRKLDIIESIYQRYFHVHDINSAFEYYLWLLKVSERKISRNNL